MINLIRKFLVVLFAGMFLLTSCKDSPTSFSETPPQIPSEQSMTMDMSELENEGSQQKTGQSYSLQAGETFQNAVLRALVMKIVVDVHLAIPRALLDAASSADAELNGDGEWVWTYSHTAGEHSFEVRLIASEIGDDQIRWEFFVTSSEHGLSDRLFFSGTSTGDGTQGNWTYFSLDAEATDEPMGDIEWTINGEDDVHLRMEVLSDSNGNLGDYIEYTFDGTVKNAVFYDASDEATTEIQWNVETHTGYLINPDFNDGVQACWDAELENTPCGEI